MTLRQFAALVVLALSVSLLLTVAIMACPAGSTSMRASWYGTESGNRTANGEYFDGLSMTAAMPSRKYLGRHYRVTYRGRSVDVRINDVGPAKWTGRGIDLSYAAAKRLGMVEEGVARVCVERL